jgi:hypothetical protein
MPTLLGGWGVQHLLDTVDRARTVATCTNVVNGINERQ